MEVVIIFGLVVLFFVLLGLAEQWNRNIERMKGKDK